MSGENLTNLRKLKFPWVAPYADAMQTALQALGKRTSDTCKSIQEYSHLCSIFREAIPNYDQIKDLERKKSLENSFLQVKYAELKNIAIDPPITPSKKDFLDLAQKETSTPNDFYTAVARYLGQDAIANQQNNTSIRNLINEHAKGRGFAFWRPSEKNTLLKLLDAAERQNNLSSREWQDVERRLTRLSNYSQNNRTYNTVPQNDAITLRQYFDHKRYGKTNDIFNQNTDVMETIINKMSREKEIEQYTHQLRNAYSSVSIQDDADFKIVLSSIDAYEDSQQEIEGRYHIPTDQGEMIQQLYFVLEPHYRTYINNIFSVNASEGTIALKNTNGLNLFISAYTHENPQFIFSILLLAQVLRYTTEAADYNEIRSNINSLFFPSEDPVSENTVDFSSIPLTKNLAWVKKYLPNTPIELPENWQEIYGQFLASFPEKAVQPTVIFDSPQKGVNDLNRDFIDTLVKEVSSILGMKTKKQQLTAQINKHISTFKEIKDDELSETLLAELYVICHSYVDNKEKSKSTQTKTEEYAPVMNYCNELLNAIKNNEDVCSVQKTLELTSLLEKKKNTIKGTQPKFSGTRLINKIDEIIKQLSETSTQRLSGSTTSSSSSGGTTTPSKQGLFASRIQKQQNTPSTPLSSPIKFSSLFPQKKETACVEIPIEAEDTCKF